MIEQGSGEFDLRRVDTVKIVHRGLGVLNKYLEIPPKSIKARSQSAGSSWRQLGGKSIAFGNLKGGAEGLVLEVGVCAGELRSVRSLPYYIRRKDGKALTEKVLRVEFDLEDRDYAVPPSK